MYPRPNKLQEIVIFDARKHASSKPSSALPQIDAPAHIEPDKNDNRLIHAIFFYHYLEAAQLTKLFYSPTSLTLVKDRLKSLQASGYLQVVQKRDGRTRKLKPLRPFVYTLAGLGLSYMRKQGQYTQRYFRPYKQQRKSELFLWHTLSVNDFLIAVAVISRRDTRVTIAEIQHELLLKTEPCLVPMGEDKSPREISPDSFIDLYLDRGLGVKKRRFSFLLELDRGTILDARDFKRKVRLLLTFFQSGAYRERFNSTNVHYLFPTTEERGRLDTMRRWIREELARTNEKKWVSDLFLSTYFPLDADPATLLFAPVWYTPFADTHPVPLLPLASPST